MSARHLTSAQRRWLESELEAWESQGVISETQGEQILGTYESEDTQILRMRSTLVFVLMSMAGFLLGLALLLLISFNWEAMSRVEKLALFLVAVPVVHGLALYLRFRRAWPMLGEIVAFIACGIYGAGIWLVAQAYHIDAHYPDGFWWWALGVVPFALLYDSLLLHALTALLLAIWVGNEVPPQLGPQPVMTALTLPLLVLPGLLSAYRAPSPWRMGVYLPLVAFWVVLQGISRSQLFVAPLWVGTVGALFLVTAEAHGIGNRLAIPYRLWGAVLSTIALSILGSTEFWMNAPPSNAAPSMGNVEPLTATYLTLLGIAVANLGLAAGVVLRAGSRRNERMTRMVIPALAAGLMGGLTGWFFVQEGTIPRWWMPVALCNLTLLSLVIYLIRTGLRDERLMPFLGGVLVFLHQAIGRYIDLADSLGMLGGAGILALTGAGLFLIAAYWSRLRVTRKKIDDKPVDTTSRLAWLTPVIEWFTARLPVVVGLAVVLQVGVLAGMVVVEALPLYVGTRVMLRVQPVDPRSLMRGDYVTLSYDFSRWPAAGIVDRNGKAVQPMYYGPVYVGLKLDEDGVHHKPSSFGTTVPTAPLYLHGRADMHQLRFGIEAYYLREGTGKRLEDLRNKQKLSAEVAVAPWGQAKLVRLIEDE
ncbi:MAG: GDYXXLXY domain-containing protein [Gemmataceae bacterium]